MVITILAFALLIIRMASLAYFFGVIKKQRALMKHPIDPEITGYRKTLHYLTVALAASNIPPIIFDIFMISKGVGVAMLTVSTTELLIFYTVTNALSALLASYLIYRIYRNAVLVDETHKSSDHTLMNEQ